jgi:mono/diheme cytochrome c family protein
MLVTGLGLAQAQGTRESSGELLYTTYCIGCHTTQVHWREKTLVTDWTGLRLQVRRWQGNVGLAPSEDEVTAVAAYLNALFYHLPEPDPRQFGAVRSIRQVLAWRRD